MSLKWTTRSVFWCSSAKKEITKSSVCFQESCYRLCNACIFSNCSITCPSFLSQFRFETIQKQFPHWHLVVVLQCCVAANAIHGCTAALGIKCYALQPFWNLIDSLKCRMMSIKPLCCFPQSKESNEQRSDSSIFISFCWA